MGPMAGVCILLSLQAAILTSTGHVLDLLLVACCVAKGSEFDGYMSEGNSRDPRHNVHKTIHKVQTVGAGSLIHMTDCNSRVDMCAVHGMGKSHSINRISHLSYVIELKHCTWTHE